MILSLYIARHFFFSIFSTLGGLTALVMVLDVVELTRRTANKSNVGFGQVLEMAFMKSPEMVIRVMPFAVLFGTMIALTRLARRSELVVIRTAGVSAWQFLRPGWVVTMLLGVLFVTLFNPIAAAMLSRFEQLEARYISGKPSVLAISDSGLWLRDFTPNSVDGVSERIFHASSLDLHDMTLHRVIIFHYGADSEFLGRYDAATARLGDGYWELEDALFSRPGQPAKAPETLKLGTQMTLEQIQDSFAPPETLSFWELPEFIQLLEEAGFSAIRHKLHFQLTLAMPLLLVGMVFIGATFSLRSPRRGRMTLLAASGVVAGFVIYFLTDLVHALGLSGGLPLVAAAWIPPIATLLGGFWLILHLEHG